jgi:predicted TIM-barrel fold metal-dependent hydrolase
MSADGKGDARRDAHDPYVVISADSHAGLPTELYRQYLERKYWPAFDDFLAGRLQIAGDLRNQGVSDEEFARKWFEEHGEGLEGGWDAQRRNKEMDDDGITAEVVFPDADAVESRTCAPFGTGLGLSGDHDPELGLAGARAHNRWLAEMCSDAPERRRGVALVQITAPLDDVLAEIRRARSSGLSVVMIPAMWMHQAPYHDQSYDPVWALCQELDMPVVTHSGPADKDSYDNHLGIYVTEVVWWPARPLWFMLWSGVFERFPNLRFGVTEAGCWWVPALLWFWDRLFMGQKGAEKLASLGLKTLPSEQFDSNCFIGASNTKRREIAMRYEIGIDNMLWGNDFPHPEGTWPKSREWLAKTYHDVPVAETRRMIGESAAEVYGFDLDALAPTADRLGVTPRTLGQNDDDAAVAAWSAHREVGRHWITGHDFPLVPVTVP